MEAEKNIIVVFGSVFSSVFRKGVEHSFVGMKGVNERNGRNSEPFAHQFHHLFDDRTGTCRSVLGKHRDHPDAFHPGLPQAFEGFFNLRALVAHGHFHQVAAAQAFLQEALLQEGVMKEWRTVFVPNRLI